MAKSFEGLSKTDPRGLELAGQESPGEPLLTAGGRAPPGRWLLEKPRLTFSHHSMSATQAWGTLHLFCFAARKWLVLSGGGGGGGVLMVPSAGDTRP